MSQLAVPVEKLGYDNAAAGSPTSGSSPTLDSSASTSASPDTDQESQHVEVKGVPLWQRIGRFLQVNMSSL